MLLVAFEACPERSSWKLGMPGECRLRFLSDQGSDDQRTADFYERAMQVAPDSPEVLNNYGYFLETRGRVAEALEKYERAAQLLLPAVHHQIDTNVKNARERLARGTLAFRLVRARPPPLASGGQSLLLLRRGALVDAGRDDGLGQAAARRGTTKRVLLCCCVSAAPLILEAAAHVCA